MIGGKLSTFGSNARLGRGEYMVAEADESDGSFLRLSPAIAVITNVDREHMDHYGDFDRVCAAFVEFANKVPFYGAVIACVDDPPLRALVPKFTRRVIGYGLDSPDADLRGEDVRVERGRATCRVLRRLTGQAATERARGREPARCRAVTTSRTRSPRWRWRSNSTCRSAGRGGCAGRVPRRRPALPGTRHRRTASLSSTTTATTRPRSRR